MADLKKIKEELKKEKLDALLISNNINITYLTGYDNFSPLEREAYLIITQNDQYILTDGRYTEAIKKRVKDFSLIEISGENSAGEILKKLSKDKKIKKLGIEEDNLTVAELKRLLQTFKTKHKSIRHIRTIKSDSEIENIKMACHIGDLAFKHILKKIRVGISEKRLAHKLEDFIKHLGAELSFPTIVAFDKNSSVPHHQTGQSVLESRDGRFVLLDFGVRYKGYCSDMTRTVFFGKASDKQKKIYQTVLEAQRLAAQTEGKEIKAANVDKAARDYIEKEGYPSIPHSVGHGIGLEVHESPHLSPKSKDILKEGMVFSIEPGIYLPGFGGVRIEDLYLYRGGKLIPLTKSPKELIEL